MKITLNHLRQIIKEEIIKESQYVGMSLEDMLTYITNLGDNTWIVLDTETTGLSRTVHEGQLTEIAAIAVKPNDWVRVPEVIGEYHEKITLHEDSEEQLEREKNLTPEEIESHGREWTLTQALDYTNYWDWDKEYIDEQVAINSLFRFIESYPNPVLVIQNAAFDLKWLSARFKQQIQRYTVVDTLRINQLFLTPLMKTLKHIKDPAAIKFLDASHGRSGLAPVRSGFGLESEGHHQAIHDVKMTLEMITLAIQALRANPDIEEYVDKEGKKVFRGAHGEAIEQINWMAQREKKDDVIYTAKWRRAQQQQRRQSEDETSGEDDI